MNLLETLERFVFLYNERIKEILTKREDDYYLGMAEGGKDCIDTLNSIIATYKEELNK